MKPDEEVFAKTLGRRLREVRLGRKLTQQQVAELARITVEGYGRIERGVHLSQAFTVSKLADALEVSADRLLGLDSLSGFSRESSARYELRTTRARRIVRKLDAAHEGARKLVQELADALGKGE